MSRSRIQRRRRRAVAHETKARIAEEVRLSRPMPEVVVVRPLRPPRRLAKEEA